MTVSMGMLIFAGLAYALEKDEPDTMFYTLPQTLYWAIITMTSTGNHHNSYSEAAPLWTSQAMEMLLRWPRPGSLLDLCARSAECSASPSPSPSLWQTSTGTAMRTQPTVGAYTSRGFLLVAFSSSQKVSFSFSLIRFQLDETKLKQTIKRCSQKNLFRF